MKYILIIGDGMADEPVERLGGKTPLEYAATPVMDSLASAGELGRALTVPEGVPAGSDTAILSIFGCDPREFYSGRAPLEAAASGIALKRGDAAYRCNMVTLEDCDASFEEKKIISHSAGSISGEDSDALITWLFAEPVFKAAAEKAGMTVYPASSFRHIAVQASANIDGIELTPPHDHLGEAVKNLLPRGCENAAVLTELMCLAHGVLDGHPINIRRRAEGKQPANGIWFWAEGSAVELPDFKAKYGKAGAVVSAVPLCRGIGALIGLEAPAVEGATGELDTNYEGKADAAFEALKTRGFAAVHVEAPDECTHDGNLEGKLQAIERLDGRTIARLKSLLDTGGLEYRMLILSDHRTLTTTRGHDGAPVPYIIYDSRFDRKTGLKYSEADAARSGGIENGTRLMNMLFEARG